MAGRTERCTIAVSSMTYAIKGQRLLGSRSIPSKVVRLHPSQTRRGCAYGIDLDCADVKRAGNILGEGRIPYSEVISASGDKV